MYCTYAELLCELSVSGDPLITATDTVLSDFTVVAGGDTFTFTGAAPSPGDALCQAGYAHEIINITGTTLKIDVTGIDTKIGNGSAKMLTSATANKKRGTDALQQALEFIDLQTRQWFEPRAKTIRFEGKNSNVKFLPVPIISVSAIRMNDEVAATDLSNFEIFDGVDNRRNPRIKVRTSGATIFSGYGGRSFIRAAYNEIDGVFGYVEEDGSTPSLIKKVTLMLAVNNLKAPLGTGSSLAGVGALKREKTDLHETEYFQPDDIRGGATGAISGDIEVDRILRMFKGPVGIGGSIMDIARTEDVKRENRENIY